MPLNNTQKSTKSKRLYALASTILLCWMLCAGCSVQTRNVYVMPPQTLLDPLPSPTVPAALEKSSDLRAYSVAATRYIVELNEAVGLRDAQLDSIRKWYESMQIELGQAQ